MPPRAASSDIRPTLLKWALDPALLRDRMCFIAGPRQIGKTTLVQRHLAKVGRPDSYFNWDTSGVRRAHRRDPDFFVADQKPWSGLLPVCFDEIHKVPKWKNVLKGLYDSWRGRIRFIVTGSARLDFMRRSGDSLVGRYFLFRRLPLHPRECVAGSPALPGWMPGDPFDLGGETSPAWRDACEQLLSLNGFPEPFLSGSDRFLARWRNDHVTLLVTEDLRDLTAIEQVLRLEELADLLRTKVGALLSINSLSRDLEVAFATLRRWLDALDLVYLTFRIPPWTSRIARAIRKGNKLYFWDWSLPSDPAARFENLVAVQLMRAVSSYNERGLGEFSLSFARTRDGVECDFVVANGRRPVLLVETKLTSTEVAPSLLKARSWIGPAVPALQVVARTAVARAHRHEGVHVVGFDRLLALLP